MTTRWKQLCALLQTTIAFCLLLCHICYAEPASSKEALPEAGGLTALPEQATEQVPLINPGFEDEWKGWRPEKPMAFSIVTKSDAVHSEKASLRLDCGQSTRYYPSLRQALKEVGPGVYTLRFWVMTRGVGPDKQKGRRRQGARLSIEYYLQNGKRVWPSTNIFGGAEDWRQKELSVYIPTDLKPGSVSISIHRYGKPSSGEAFFDDLSLERVLPPPVEAFLLYPNYRGFLPEDGAENVRLWVRVNEKSSKQPIEIEVRSADDDRRIAAMTLPATTKEQVLELNAKQWPLGRYLVQTLLGSYRYPPYAIQKISSEQKQRFAVWFDSRQVLHLHGKPTFPIGLYSTMLHFAWETLDFEAELKRLRKMSEAPVSFNINYWWWPCNSQVRHRYLTQMQKHGVWYLDTVNNVYPGFPRTSMVTELLPDAPEKLNDQELIDRYQSRLAQAMHTMPAFGGWYVMDEKGFGLAPRHFHQYQALRKADPDHPTYGVSNKPSELHFWRDTLDVIGLDPYPLFNMRAGRPLTMAGQWTRAAVEATQGSRPVWMVIQFFQGWSIDRWPTEEELRTMSLMAVVEGARGVFYWSFGSKGVMTVRDPKKKEEYWQQLVKVTKEIKSLEPALIAVDAPKAVKKVSDPRICWRARIADGKCYVFAYMPSEKFVSDPSKAERVEVRFTIADGRTVTRNFRPDFADWFAVPAPLLE